MFIVRAAFWLTLILLILPIDREAAGISSGPGALETLGAVQTIVSDARGFCDRNPGTCATGAATVDVLRQKAIYSAAVVQGWLSEQAVDPIQPAATGPVVGPRTDEPTLVPTQSTASVARSYVLEARLPTSDHPPL